MRIQKASPEDVTLMRRRLREFNEAAAGDSSFSDFAAKAVDEAGALCGGIIAHTSWNILEVTHLWVESGSRERGIGTSLLAAAEDFGLSRGCSQSLVDTYGFQAPQFYVRRGYVAFAELHDCPRGHTRFYMRKLLAASN